MDTLITTHKSLETSTPVVVTSEDMVTGYTNSTVLPAYDNLYKISTAGISEFYNGSYIPSWLDTAIAGTIQLYTGPIAIDMSALQTYVDGIESGVNSSIDSINNSVLDQYTYTNTVKSELEGNIAVNANDITTRVTATEAESIVYSLVGSQFIAGNGVAANAWLQSEINSYAAGSLASITSVQTLQASVNEASAAIQTVDSVTMRATKYYSAAHASPPGPLNEYNTGDLWKVTDRFYADSTPEYVKNEIRRWDGYNWFLLDPNANTDMSYFWSAVSSKLIRGPHGEITGWTATDGSESASTFSINADNFYIQNSSNDIASRPFAIEGNNVRFNGVVDFTNVENTDKLLATGDAAADVNGGTTTINGGKITTNSINAAQINANAISTSHLMANIVTVGQEIKSSNFSSIGGAGFRLKSGADNTHEDPTIYGAYIRGGTVEGATVLGAYGKFTKNNAGVQGALFVDTSGITDDYFGQSVRGYKNGLSVTCYNPGGRAIRATSLGSDAGVSYGLDARADSEDGVGVSGYSYQYVGVMGSTAASSGEWGFRSSDKAYIAGGVSPFTGSHIVTAAEDILIGDIVAVDLAIGLSISQSYMAVSATTDERAKAVVGVCAQVVDDLESWLATDTDYNTVTYEQEAYTLNPEDENSEVFYRDDPTAPIYTPKEEYIEYMTDIVAKGYVRVTINALGEGMLNVCSTGGDIENGDFICSSEILGKGMRQQDALMYNYTVGKSLTDVVWENEVVGTKDCFSYNGVKCKRIPCTYHCG